jgi:hypothetical protein
MAAPSRTPVQTEGINQRDLPAARLTAPPVIDGDLSDPAWQQAGRSERFTDALNGSLVPDQTEVYLGFDDRYIYVAFRCHDSQPSGIIARETKRGTRFQGEDTVAFSIDPFHTHKFADRSFFIVNPLGTQFAHLSGGRGTKLEWEGKWQSTAKITADGWVAEMAIPWEVLNHPGVRGPTTCGINFDRYQQRSNTHSWWSNLGSPERDELDGHWVGVRFPAFHPKLSLLPYASPGWEQRNGQSLRSGLDARGALTPSLTLVGTVNPDFRNVEEAVEGIDFSYGERFVPDRRPFFQEGSDVFRSGGAAGRFFYSRRVDAFDTGVSLYGKTTPRDTVGAFAALDLGHRADWLLRGRHEFGSTASIDFAFLNRDDSHLTNRVLVVGQGVRRGHWSTNATWAGSWLSGGPGGSTANLFLNFESPRWYATLAPFYVNPRFHDELGFIQFTDYKGVNTELGYFREWHQGPFRNLSVDASSQDSHHYDGRLFRQRRAFSTFVQTRSDYGLSLEWNGGRFEQFRDHLFLLNLRVHTSDPFHNFGVGYAWGREAGAPYSFLTPGVTWRFGQKLTLGLSSSFLSHKESAYQHILTFNYDFSPQQGIGARVVAQNGGTNGYFAYRRSGYGGIERFLIFGDPNAKHFTQRLVFKVVWPI